MIFSFVGIFFVESSLLSSSSFTWGNWNYPINLHNTSKWWVLSASSHLSLFSSTKPASQFTPPTYSGHPRNDGNAGLMEWIFFTKRLNSTSYCLTIALHIRCSNGKLFIFLYVSIVIGIINLIKLITVLKQANNILLFCDSFGGKCSLNSKELLESTTMIFFIKRIIGMNEE